MAEFANPPTGVCRAAGRPVAWAACLCGLCVVCSVGWVRPAWCEESVRCGGEEEGETSATVAVARQPKHAGTVRKLATKKTNAKTRRTQRQAWYCVAGFG